MKKLLFSALAVVSLYALPAQALLLTPENTVGLNLGPKNCEPECVESYFHVTDLDLLYKAEVKKDGSVGESGLLASSYQTTFTDTPLDPSAALIKYMGGSFVDCPVCYLAIKDGKQLPSYYFYNLAAWDGQEDLVLSGFWPDNGAISHVSIWGKNYTSVPEPATLSLLGAGLLLFGLKGKRRSPKDNA